MLVRRHLRYRQTCQVVSRTPQAYGRRGLLGTCLPEQRSRPLLAVECLEYLVRTHRLVPVNVVRVVGAFVEAPCSVAVEDRPAESSPFHRVAVAANRAVAASENELERTRARLTEQSDGVLAETTRVVTDVVKHLVHELRVVQPAENLGDHGLLVGREEVLDADRGDVPVVVDLRSQRVVEREGDLALLLGGQALVELRHQCLRGRMPGGGGNARSHRRSSQGSRLQKLSTINGVTILT